MYWPARNSRRSFAGSFRQDAHDVRRQPLHLLHAARQRPHLDVLDRADLAAFDHEIGERFRLAEERVALLPFRLGQRRVLVRAVVDAAFEHFAFARAARAVTAAVGDDEAFAQRGFEHGVVVLRFESVIARFDRYAMGHGRCFRLKSRFRSLQQ